MVNRSNRATCRIATIGPLVLFGFFGLTFYYGMGPARRSGIVQEAAFAAPTRFSTPRSEVSVPVLINGKRARVIMPKECLATPKSMLRTTVYTSGTESRRSSDRELANVAPHSHGSSVRGPCSHCGVGAWRDGLVPLPPIRRFVGSSTWSFRNFWKAGPGDTMDEQQVKPRVLTRRPGS